MQKVKYVISSYILNITTFHDLLLLTSRKLINLQCLVVLKLYYLLFITTRDKIVIMRYRMRNKKRAAKSEWRILMEEMSGKNI